MISKLVFWIVTAIISGLALLLWYFFKKYINGLSDKISILFKKLDRLIDSLGVIDRVLGIQEQKIIDLTETVSKLETKSEEMEKRLAVTELKTSQIETICTMKGNKR